MIGHFRLHFLMVLTCGLPLKAGTPEFVYWSMEARLVGRILHHGGFGRRRYIF